MFTCKITKKEFQRLCLYQQKKIRTIDDKLVCSRCDYFRRVKTGTCKVATTKQKTPIPRKDLYVFTRFPSLPDGVWIIDSDKEDEFLKQNLDFQRSYVTQRDLDPQTFLLLQMREKSFQETQNPVYAIEAFLLTRENGLYPPFWILDWLSKGFEEYHKSNGQKQIGPLLGFTGRSFKKLIEKDRDEWLMENVWRLNKFCSYDVKAAAMMVAEYLKRNPQWNKTGLKLRTLDGPTLASRYSAEGWEQTFNQIGREKIQTEWFKSAKWKRRYLNLFKKQK